MDLFAVRVLACGVICRGALNSCMRNEADAHHRTGNCPLVLWPAFA